MCLCVYFSFVYNCFNPSPVCQNKIDITFHLFIINYTDFLRTGLAAFVSS